MVATIASMTDTSTEYEVVVEQGQPLHCTCMAHFYHPEKSCKHMIEISRQINAEIARAARFLAVRREVQGMEETWKANRQIFYSEW